MARFPIEGTRRYLDRPVFTNRFVGRKTQTIRGKGQNGQPLFLAGTDLWTGGVGPTTNNEIFGGEGLGADWTATLNDAAVIAVGSRQAILIGGKSNQDAPSSSMQHSSSGTQNVDGNLTVIFWAKITGTAADIISPRGLQIGFDGTGNNDRAAWTLDASVTQWKPIIANAGVQTGSAVAVTADTWTRFKIIIKSGSTDFYINDVLKENLASGINNPDDAAMAAFASLGTIASSTGQTELRIRRVRAVYGTT